MIHSAIKTQAQEASLNLPGAAGLEDEIDEIDGAGGKEIDATEFQFTPL
jgi:hypothetical protein